MTEATVTAPEVPVVPVAESRRRFPWPVVVLALAASLVFLPGLRGDFVWDDFSLILRNEHIRNPGHLPATLTQPFWATSDGGASPNSVYAQLYRPIISLAYIAQFQAFGEDAFGYHVVSLVLHVLCVLLAWLFLRSRLGSGLSDFAIASLLGALIFAVHPSRPESVAWISGSTDLWMTGLLLAGYLAWERRPATWAAPVTAVCFALAILCKETAIVAPALLALDAWCGRARGKELRSLVTVGGAVAATMAVRVAFVPLHGGGMIPRSGTDVERILCTLGLYIEEALSPWSPSTQIGPRHALPDGTPLFDQTAVLLGGATVVLAVALLVLVRVPSRFRDGVRPFAADFFWFLLPLLPVLNMLDLASYTLASDRFLYLPMLGLASMATRAVALAIRRGPPLRGAAMSVAACLVVGYAVISFAHTTHFHDTRTLWSYEHDLNPKNIYVLGELASIAHSDERPDVAMDLDWIGYQVGKEEGNEWTAATFASAWAQEAMSITADADQATLSRIRDAYLSVPTSSAFVLTLGERTVTAKLSAPAKSAFLTSAKYYRVPRAISLLRTDRVKDGTKELIVMVGRANDATAWTLLVTAFARLGNFEFAEQALAKATAALPSHPGIQRMGMTLHRAEAIAKQPASDDVATVIRDARVQLVLGGIVSAQRKMNPLLAGHPDRWDVAVAAAEVHAADRQYDQALALLAAAKGPTGVPQAVYDQTVAQLEGAKGRAAFITKIW